MKRIIFIDLVRAFAILSMVQGHLISGVLADTYATEDSTLYFLWNFNRGLTAPVFFFISGLIFTFLLFKNSDKDKNPRIAKGIWRAALLISIGYLLQFNKYFFYDFPQFDVLRFQHMFMMHVLQSIGFGLLFIILLYFLTDKLKIPFWFLSLVSANLIFLLEPVAIKMSWIHYMPLPIATFFNRDFSSIFPLIPWLGFVSWGALAGYLIHKYPAIIKHKFTPLYLAVFALIFQFFYRDVFEILYQISHSEILLHFINKDFTYFRFANVLFVISLFIFISNVVKNIPQNILKIGQNTLLIYILHYLILYGTTDMKGVVQIYRNSLNPWESIILALAVEALIIIAVINKDRIISFLNSIYQYISELIRLNINIYLKKKKY